MSNSVDVVKVNIADIRPGDALLSTGGLPILPRACLVASVQAADCGGVSLHILDSVSAAAGEAEIRERVWLFDAGAELRRVVRAGERYR